MRAAPAQIAVEMHFASPGWLLLLIPAAALLTGHVIAQLRRKRHVAWLTNVELFASVAPRRPGWRRQLTFALLLIALTLLSLGSAQPTAAMRVPLIEPR
jgi:Ca-activated chloride channel homolog